MTDPRVENLAKILVNYSTKVKPGDWVYIQADMLAKPLANEVVRHVLRAGGHPNIVLDDDEIKETIYTESSEEQLKWVSPIQRMAYVDVDVLIVLRAPNNTHALSGIDPKKQQIYHVARRELTETYMRRSAEGSLHWVLTQFPCPAYAQDADMSVREFADFVYAATFADQADPIQRWQAVHDDQERLIDWLKGKQQVSLRSPNCDLQLSIAGRSFINSDGKNNMPSGEIFTSPMEDSANGWVNFTYPAVHRGREVTEVKFEFKDGRVVNASAEKNEAYLLAMLDSDEGARYLGEFAIGTNYGIQRFTKSILYDEKIGGSFHLAVGAGFPEVGQVNQSSIHWDFICDIRQDSEIRVDGELFYKDGKFQV
jgi:aminopeptidase